MKNLRLRAALHIIPSPSCSPPLFVKPIKVTASSCGKGLKHHSPSKFAISPAQQSPISLNRTPVGVDVEEGAPKNLVSAENGHSRLVIMGAVSVGILVLMSGLDEQKAWALGPEGPLVEEFWDNVRRYGLYALTVSTGAIYTILQPILELLKNPISALLIIAILGGSFYLVSQVLSAMVGVTDFAYDYAN